MKMPTGAAALGGAMLLAAVPRAGAQPAATAAGAAAVTDVVDRYCTRCHNERSFRGNLSLVGFDVARADEQPETAERMIRKLRAGMMPPPGARRPAGDTLAALATQLEDIVDMAAASRPYAGTRPFQRLNRAEYARVVHDLLGLTVDPAEWLPPDPITDGFDNIAVAQTLSPTLMDAYLAAASEVARRAVGDRDAAVSAVTYTNSSAVSQHEWERAEGAPFGTRGGISVLHSFPADGEYTFEMSFMSGWGERFHDIDVSVDGERAALLRYGGDIDFQGRKGFPVRTEPVFVRAGEHRLAAAFIRKMDGPYEDLIRPNDWSLTGTETSYGTTSLPHIMSLTVEGPYNPTGVSDFAARRRVFSCRPTTAAEELPCARAIVSRLAADAYGRDLGGEETDDLLGFYRLGARDGGFETGIRTALEAFLSSPHFLFRMEREPASVRPGEIFPLAAEDLAARLSFFLWGTVPDDLLAEAARDGSLADPAELEAQTRRLLADPRAEALATRFASLWLRLQDVEKVVPDAFRFPDYSRQLAEAMRRETELFFHNLVQEDRSLLSSTGPTTPSSTSAWPGTTGSQACTATRSGGLRTPTTAGAASSVTEAFWFRRRSGIARRPCCAASGSWRFCSALRPRPRRRGSRTWRRPKAPATASPSPPANGWRCTAQTRAARRATTSSIRSGWRWTTSMSPAAGGSARRARSSTRAEPSTTERGSRPRATFRAFCSGGPFRSCGSSPRA